MWSFSKRRVESCHCSDLLKLQGLGELSFVELRVWKSEPAAAFMACSSEAEEAATRGQNR